MNFPSIIQMLDETNYTEWSIRMQVSLKAARFDVWKSIATDYTAPKEVNTFTQKDARKNNSMAMETILEGLTDSTKEKIGKCSSAKELWQKVEKLCSKGHDTKYNSDSVKESSSEYYDPNENIVSKSSSMTDHSDCEEEEGIVDLEVELEATLEEINSMHKVINKQAKKLFLLQPQLEEVKNREVDLLKIAQDKEEKLAKTKEEINSR